MLDRGKLLILAILTVAISAAGLSVWWHHAQGRRAQEFWGTQSAVLIRHAPRVEVLQLQLLPDQEPSVTEQLMIQGLRFQVSRKKDISNLPGLLHARHALIEDASFKWEEPVDDAVGKWSYVLRFSAGDQIAAVVLDFQCQRARLLGTSRDVIISDRIMRGLHKYTSKLFEMQADSSSADDG